MTLNNPIQSFSEIVIQDTDIRIVSYTVKLPTPKTDKKLIIKTFENKDFLLARENAFKMAIEARDKANDYKGIQVILLYTETDSKGKCRRKNHKILTGWRMGTHKILPSLAREASLLLKENKTFPKMICTVENDEYICVDQLFNTLYYFTF